MAALAGCDLEVPDARRGGVLPRPARQGRPPARQRRRVYQSGKGRATNRGGPGGRPVHRWPVCRGRDLPRPAPRQRRRAGVRLSVAGRSAAFRRRRFGPALLREAPRCSCPAVACGDRGVSDSTWAAGLLFGADGAAVTVSLDRVRPGMPPRPPPLPRHATTVPASMQDACSRPLAPRERSRSLARPPPAVSRCPLTPAIGRMAHPVRFAPAARRSSGMAHPCPRGCISRPQLRHTRVSRDLRFGTWASPSTSYGGRARAGFPPAVWSHQSVGMAPDHAATGRLPHGRYDSASTKAAPEQSS